MNPLMGAEKSEQTFFFIKYNIFEQQVVVRKHDIHVEGL